MNIDELLSLFRQAGKRAVRIDGGELSAVVAPDLEGRIYYAKNGRVISRVNPAAIAGRSSRAGYLNPGGDGLWPAPEGTVLGYQYGTGAWRVPNALVNARFQIIRQSESELEIEAEVDLVNARQLALPTIFRRRISFRDHAILQEDSIEYIGMRTLERGEFLLAPWSLCQFDAGAEAYGSFPAASRLRDLYGDSSGYRSVTAPGDLHVRRSETERWQLAVGAEADQVELVLPESSLRLRRTTEAPQSGSEFIDIADASPDEAPSPDGVRFSIYSDPAGFMEIESVGTCRFPLKPGTRLSLRTVTEILEV